VPIYVLPKITDYHKEGFVTDWRQLFAIISQVRITMKRKHSMLINSKF